MAFGINVVAVCSVKVLMPPRVIRLVSSVALMLSVMIAALLVLGVGSLSLTWTLQVVLLLAKSCSIPLSLGLKR